MPSDAFGKFQYNLVDVDRLIESHAALGPTGQGRRGLGHVTRSGVVMLCASWELYIEHLLVECAAEFTNQLALPTQLPREVQRSISLHVKESKHELKPLQMSGDGWKQVYRDFVNQKVAALNTPKATNIDTLLRQLVGISDLSTAWTIGAARVDAFVTVRGDIAHRGRHAAYVQRGQLENYRNEIRTAAVDTDNHISNAMRSLLPRNRKPWRATR
jgi:hypothetical protein